MITSTSSDIQATLDKKAANCSPWIATLHNCFEQTARNGPCWKEQQDSAQKLRVKCSQNNGNITLIFCTFDGIKMRTVCLDISSSNSIILLSAFFSSTLRHCLEGKYSTSAAEIYLYIYIYIHTYMCLNINNHHKFLGKRKRKDSLN